MTQTEVTAGFRNAEWTLNALPEGPSVGVFPLRTIDGAATNGFLYRRGEPKAIVCIMHPREFLATHYMIPPLIEAGSGVFTQTPRAVGNDLRLEHEVALLDVAAGMTFLKNLGAARIVLLGNSGGSGLYCLYNEQSLLAPAERLERTPGGRPVPLAKADMPAADAVVLLSPHPGQGRLLMNALDPSVVDEADPFFVDPQLDPFAADNGFSDTPQSVRYAADFVARYKVGQHARVERLDAIARERIAERLAARTAPAIRQPTLMVHYTGDQTLFPSDAAAIFEAIGTPDKTIVSFRGDHHGRALHEGEPGGRASAGAAIGQWLNEYCPPS
jgi:alpha-beta hydrolase superfamily lysophospholipase